MYAALVLYPYYFYIKTMALYLSPKILSCHLSKGEHLLELIFYPLGLLFGFDQLNVVHIYLLSFFPGPEDRYIINVTL